MPSYSRGPNHSSETVERCQGRGTAMSKAFNRKVRGETSAENAEKTWNSRRLEARA